MLLVLCLVGNAEHRAVEKLRVALDYAEELRQIRRGAQADLNLLLDDDVLAGELDAVGRPVGVVEEDGDGRSPGIRIRRLRNAPVDETYRGHCGHLWREIVIASGQRRGGGELRPTVEVKAAGAVADGRLVYGRGNALGIIAVRIAGPGAVHVVPLRIGVGLLGAEADMGATIAHGRQVGEWDEVHCSLLEVAFADLLEPADDLTALDFVAMLGGGDEERFSLDAGVESPERSSYLASVSQRRNGVIELCLNSHESRLHRNAAHVSGGRRTDIRSRRCGGRRPRVVRRSMLPRGVARIAGRLVRGSYRGGLQRRSSRSSVKQ